MDRFHNTIVAPATPPGEGAIGIIRLSGKNAFAIADTIFRGKVLSRQASHTLHYGWIADKETLLDEVIAAVFRAPAGYTGEDTIEFNCHGSSYILEQTLQLCMRHGAELAQPGEFTLRAFLNGKMDLAQAEAVADLIAAENQASHDMALRQMRGGVSSALAVLREQLIHFTALLELELDFSEEDVEFADRQALQDLITALLQQTADLIASFEYGNALKNGVPVAIIGKPNAGKSTLLNALLKEERAIVSDIAGTTRDIIEETINLQGITFRFIDTAGIRETDDVIEAIGVERAKEKVKQAKVVIHLYEKDTDLLDQLADTLKGKLVFNLASKADKHPRPDTGYLQELSQKYPDYQHFDLSVSTGYHMDLLTGKLVSHFSSKASDNTVIISNTRHKEALEQARDALREVEKGLQQHLTGDLLSLHLKDALRHLGSITGKIDVDKDILGTIFGKFCIGK